ncbi:GNAT family acetyltransferase [Erysipelothrix larvae]|uniref:GNAT family acetyltransferase n=1 Tax=Erysipelothrix larvae TaxID=1514105 RepID=A0A120JTS2_9FIRM|nr:GNAT family N-acetyltransferase [Erysipelothrix larvae]AMC93780.1 GNAT family acetyltransferase [Erysipelothrix larvae]
MKLKLEKTRIVLFDDAREIGEITWIEGEGVITIDHTFVNPDYRGQGLAKDLLDASVEMARAKGLKIIPQCPYVKREFEKSDEYKDVWAH